MARPKKVRPITSAEMLEFIDCATLEILEVIMKCPRLLYQSQCKFSVDDSAG